LLADDTAPTFPDIDRDRLRFLETRQARQAAEDVPLDSKTRLSIQGLPGTGKTWALLSIARHHAAAGKRVLFLCYNQVLHADLQRIGAGIDASTFREHVDFHTLFGFYEQFAANARIEPSTYDDATAEIWIALMAEELAAHPDRPVYDLIVVDEAQDMLDPLEPVLRHCIAVDGSIVVAVGLGQELYRESADWLDRFQSVAKEQRYTDVYRTPAASFCVAQALRESAVDEKLICPNIRRIVDGHCVVPAFLQVDLRNPGTTVPALSVIPGPARPGDDLEAHWSRELGKVFESARRRLRGDEVPRDILFLLPSSKSVLRNPLMRAIGDAGFGVADLIGDKQRVPAPQEVRISTYHSARGVEARVVVLLDLAKLLENNPNHRNAQTLAYIGLTRSLRDTILVEERERRSRIGEMIEEIGERVRYEIDRERPRFLELNQANLPDGYFADDGDDPPID
ncbi:MAG: DNA/RNA helicase domain-containing protein, partial [Armatimonadota bacterium]